MSPISTQDLPEIVISSSDHERLFNLATGALRRDPATAEDLLSELDRATVVESDAVPDSVVRMGSAVDFRFEDGDTHHVSLVFPLEADIARSRLSVMTPVGAALIGLTTGQSIQWTTPNGRERRLTVTGVSQPVRDPETPAAA